MKIAVCVKHVPEGHGRIQPDTKRLDRSGPGELNDADKNAIEEALRIKGDGDARGRRRCRMGPEQARRLVAHGARHGRRPGGARQRRGRGRLRSRGTSKVLAKALEREEADLVLFGQQTERRRRRVLWAAVAERLRRPFVSQAADARPLRRHDRAGDSARPSSATT